MKSRYPVQFRLFVFLLLVISGLNLAIRADDYNKKLKTDFFLLQARDKNLSGNQRLAFYDSAMSMNKDYSLVIEKGRLYESLCEFHKALELFKNPDHDLDKLSQVSLPQFLETKMLAAVDYFIVNNWDDCIRTCYEIIRTPKPDSLLYYEIGAYRRLTYLFADINNPTLAAIALNKADSLMTIYKKSEASQWDKDHMEGKLRMASSYLASTKGDYSLAFDEEKKCRNIFGDKVPQLHNSINLGCIYYEIGEYSMAEKIFKDALAEYVPDLEYEQTYLNYIETLHTVGKTDEANRLFNERKDVLHEKFKNTIYENFFYDTDYKLAIALNDTARALNALLKSTELTTSNYKRYRDLYINQLNDSLEHPQSGIYDGSSRENQPLGKSLIILCCIIAALTGTLIYLGARYWKLSKSSDEDSHLLEEYKKSIEDNERKNEESLESRNRELMAMSMHMFQLNESITEIDRYASDSSLPQPELRNRIKLILKDLSSQEHVWEMFKIYFEDVNQKFFDILYKINPDLTKSELRMCAYIRAGMSSKEIAAATNRSVRTVDSIKYNLRKKLGIEESTDAFIRRITSETG